VGLTTGVGFFSSNFGNSDVNLELNDLMLGRSIGWYAKLLFGEKWFSSLKAGDLRSFEVILSLLVT